MANDKKRITELTEATEVKTDHYIPVDHNSYGTQKMKISTLMDTTLTTSGEAADAQATGNAIATEATARAAADGNLADQITVERNRITNLATLTEGSTTGDAELIDIRVGADGTTYSSAGNAVRGQVSALKEELNDVTVFVESVNRFNINTITPMSVIGSNGNTQSSSDSFTSDFIKCEPGQTFRLYRLTENNSFVSNSTVIWLAEYDENKTFISRASWKNNVAVGDNTHYIRFSLLNTLLTDKIIAITFDAILTAETIAEFNDTIQLINQEQVDDNTSAIEQINSKIEPLIGQEYLSSNDFEQGGYASITNYSAPVPTENTIRIRCEKTVSDSNPVIIERNNDGFDFVYALFDENDSLIRGTGSWQSESIYVDTKKIKTIRISIRKSDNSVISVSDFENSGINVKIPTFLDTLNLPIKLKVMTYNIGRYSYGVSPYYLSENYEEKLSNYKKFFAEEKCDIIGLQELNTYLDDATTGDVTSNDAIFNYLYPYYKDTSNWTCIKSKYKLDGTGQGAFVSSSRTYAYASLIINGKSIFLLCVHTTPNAGTTQDELRAQEIAEMISLVNDKDYFIIFGDFNAQTTALYDPFINARYHLANGGYLPFEWTYSYDPVDFSTDTPGTGIRYFDNIITSDNITVDYSERLNVYSKLSSDHIPFVAYLTIN